MFSVEPTSPPWYVCFQPVSWDEVEMGCFRPQDFTMLAAPARVAQLGDLFAPALRESWRLDQSIEGWNWPVKEGKMGRRPRQDSNLRHAG